MNIAVFADLHGRILLAFKLCVRWQRETGERIDLVLQAGDLGAYPDLNRLDRATIKHLRDDPSEAGFSQYFVNFDPDIAHQLETTNFPILFVRGNHEDHAWLDELEKQSEGAIFPVDAYQRIFCMKTGMPYIFSAGGEAITILGIGRIAPPVGEGRQHKPKYIQPYELERIYDLPKGDIDLLLTHDTARDFVTAGYGMEEIRLVLDAHKPTYHFHGHTEEPFTRRMDSNKTTVVYKMADLHWDAAKRGKPLEPGAMGILRWHDSHNHSFEVVEAEWLSEYTAVTWPFIP